MGRRKAKHYSMITGLVLFCSMLINPALSAYSGGTGEPNDPYQIATAEDLIALGNEPNDYNDCFVLTADIDLSGYSFDRAVIAPDVNDEESWHQGTGFSGSFNGQGYVISHLQINGQQFLGLFGRCSGGIISNLGLESVDVNGMGGYVGGVAGYNSANIMSSYSTGSVDGDRAVGGLVGYNSCSIILSYSTCSVSGNHNVGGLVGYNYCGNIASSYSIGSVSDLVGYNVGIVISSFWDAETSKISTSRDGGVGLTTAEMQNINTFLDAGWDFVGESANGTCDFWMMDENAYPRLSVFSRNGPVAPPGAGTPVDPYLITTPEELGAVWLHPGACYRLEADLDLTGIQWSSAVVPNFGGFLDGQGHVIRNLHLEGGGYLGLFGKTTSNAVIHCLGLESVDVNGVGSCIGGLVGRNAGMVTESYVTGIVSEEDLMELYGNGSGRVGGLAGYNSGAITLSYSAAVVSGSFYVGGLVGDNWDGTITSSYSMSPVDGDCSRVGGLVGRHVGGAIKLSYSTGVVSGSDEVGGLVGYNCGGMITSSYSMGAVSGEDAVGGLAGRHCGHLITSSYSMSEVCGDYRVGGLVGYNCEGMITSCYNTGTVCGDDNVGGLVGYNYFGMITVSYNTGKASGDENIGGLVGYHDQGMVMSSYSTCVVSGDEGVGGLVGYNDLGLITVSYSTGLVSGNTYAGGLVGYSYYGTITSCFWDTETSGLNYSAGGVGLTTSEMQNINTYLEAGWDLVGESANGTCEFWIFEGNSYPRLSFFSGEVPATPSGAGTSADPYLITTAQELGAIWLKPAACYRLEADLDLADIQWSNAVVPHFEGVFDGQGHVIRNLHIEGGMYLGLFGKTSYNAAICSLGLESVDVNGVGFWVGAMVGCHSGTITSGNSTGKLSASSGGGVGGLVGLNYYGTISSSYSTAAISGGLAAGGLAGENLGTIKFSCSTGTVSGDGNWFIGGLVGRNSATITSSYSTGSVRGEMYVGGFVGYNDGVITLSYGTGSVTGTGDYIGGLIGYNDYDSLTSSFWDVETSGQSTSAGGVGLTTAQMQDINTFLDVDWDFVDETANGTDDIWWMPVGDYPRLWWELVD